MAIERIKTVMKIGNSLGITIPKPYFYALGVKPKDLVICRLTRDTIEIIPYGGNNQCKAKS